MDYGFDGETFIILKDVHEELNNQKIIALLKRIAENMVLFTIIVRQLISVIPFFRKTKEAIRVQSMLKLVK